MVVLFLRVFVVGFYEIEVKRGVVGIWSLVVEGVGVGGWEKGEVRERNRG